MKRFSFFLALLLILSLPCMAADSGDMNENSVLDSDDAVYLLYYTLLPEEYPLNQPADYTGDGVIDYNDAVCLLYHTVLPEVYALPFPADGVQLPEIGYDPDGKGRIELIDASLAYGTFSFTFRNNSSVWLTDEASTIAYRCTNADGQVVASGNMLLGHIACNSTRVCTLPLPEGTAAIRFTGRSITYWSDWKV